MSIIADTDVLIDFLAGHEPSASRIALELERGDLRTTAVTRFELLGRQAGSTIRRNFISDVHSYGYGGGYSGGYGYHPGYAAYRGFVGCNPRPSFRCEPQVYCPPPPCYAPPVYYRGHHHHGHGRGHGHGW